MKHILPEEIAELDEQINELKERRKEIYKAWADSISPWKIGDRVQVKHGNCVRLGTIAWVTPTFDSFDYGIDVELKKGGIERIKIYSWALENITKPSTNTTNTKARNESHTYPNRLRACYGS